MKITIDRLYVLAGIRNGEPYIYGKIFTEDKKQEAEDLAKELKLEVKNAYINNNNY